MIGILIVAHDQLGKALIDTSRMIYGDSENLKAVSFVHGEGLDILKNKIIDEVNEMETENGCMVLLDIFAGTPMNASIMALGDREDVEFVYGVNIPMLLEVLSMRDTCDVKELSNIALEAGGKSIGSVSKSNALGGVR